MSENRGQKRKNENGTQNFSRFQNVVVLEKIRYDSLKLLVIQ